MIGESGSASSPLTVRLHPSAFNNSTTQRQIGFGREGLRQEKTPVLTFRPCLFGYTSSVRRSGSLSRRCAQYKTIRCEYAVMFLKPLQNSEDTIMLVTSPSTFLTVPMKFNLLPLVTSMFTASSLFKSPFNAFAMFDKPHDRVIGSESYFVVEPFWVSIFFRV